MPQLAPSLVFKAFPCLAAKNIIKLILLLTIWWCPCVESSVVGRRCLLWPVHSLGKTLLAFDLLNFVFQGQIFLLFSYLLTSYFSFPSPIMKRASFWGVRSRSSCKSSWNLSTSASSALLVGAHTWNTVIFSGFPWKQTEIILSFLRLYPSTAF